MIVLLQLHARLGDLFRRGLSGESKPQSEFMHMHMLCTPATWYLWQSMDLNETKPDNGYRLPDTLQHALSVPAAEYACFMAVGHACSRAMWATADATWPRINAALISATVVSSTHAMMR